MFRILKTPFDLWGRTASCAGLTARLFCVAILSAASIPAQYPRPTLTKGVDIKQKLGSPVPLDLVFRDETGQVVPLRSFFGEKPVVFSLVYYKCPSLCPMSLRETVLGLKRVSLQAGLDYNVLVVSFDPNDTPSDSVVKKAEYEKMFGRAGFNGGFHFLTGTQENIKRLTDAIGFGYRWDEGTKQFIHAGGIMVATPEGKMSRYFYGTDYAPADLRMALIDSSKRLISSPINYVLSFCYHYDVTQGKYTLAIVNILKVAGTLTVFLLAGLIYFLMRNNKKPKVDLRWKEVEHVR